MAKHKHSRQKQRQSLQNQCVYLESQLTRILKVSLRISRNLGMSEKASKQVVTFVLSTLTHQISFEDQKS